MKTVITLEHDDIFEAIKEWGEKRGLKLPPSKLIGFSYADMKTDSSIAESEFIISAEFESDHPKGKAK